MTLILSRNYFLPLSQKQNSNMHHLHGVMKTYVYFNAITEGKYEWKQNYLPGNWMKKEMSWTICKDVYGYPFGPLKTSTAVCTW